MQALTGTENIILVLVLSPMQFTMFQNSYPLKYNSVFTTWVYAEV